MDTRQQGPMFTYQTSGVSEMFLICNLTKKQKHCRYSRSYSNVNMAQFTPLLRSSKEKDAFVSMNLDCWEVYMENGNKSAILQTMHQPIILAALLRHV